MDKLEAMIDFGKIQYEQGRHDKMWEELPDESSLIYDGFFCEMAKKYDVEIPPLEDFTEEYGNVHDQRGFELREIIEKKITDYINDG